MQKYLNVSQEHTTGIKHMCPSGTFNPIQGAIQCISCPLGTYSTPTEVGLSEKCTPCPENHICVNPYTIQQCPENTISAQGSTNIINCVCENGFLCSVTQKVSVQVAIYKPSEMSLTDLNQTIQDLNENEEFIYSMRANFAEAKELDISQVVFTGFHII